MSVLVLNARGVVSSFPRLDKKTFADFMQVFAINGAAVTTHTQKETMGSTAQG